MNVEQPPTNFEHPFSGKVVIQDQFGGELTAWNGPCFPWLGVDACAKLVGNVCYIYAQKGKLTPELKRHEIAHCNGWPADHPR